MLHPDRSDAISGPTGRGSIDPRPTGCSSAVVTLTTPSGLSTGRPSGESRGVSHFPVIFGEQTSPGVPQTRTAPPPVPQ